MGHHKHASKKARKIQRRHNRLRIQTAAMLLARGNAVAFTEKYIQDHPDELDRALRAALTVADALISRVNGQTFGDKMDRLVEEPPASPLGLVGNTSTG